MTDPVMAHGAWKTNGQMILDVARLGYIGDTVLDMTYGIGGWWTDYQPDPDGFVGVDLDPSKDPRGNSVDFTDLPFSEASFDTVAYDPPYKLNGTPDPGLDHRYGVDKPATIAQRHELMILGLLEAKRVSREYVLAKCQDQVCSGRMWWQTDMLTRVAEADPFPCRKVDSLQMPSYRAQPHGRRQVHARRNFSTLLVFRREDP